MIITNIFESCNSDESKALDDILKQVNDFISENNITKDDIIEYRTDSGYDNIDDDCYIKITISFWK